MRGSRAPKSGASDKQTPMTVGAADSSSPQQPCANAGMKARGSALQLHRGHDADSFGAFCGRGLGREETSFRRPVSD